MLQISLKKLKYANGFRLNHVKYPIGGWEIAIGFVVKIATFFS